jgi:hypothetical protein
MPHMGFELTIPMHETVKTIQALDNSLRLWSPPLLQQSIQINSVSSVYDRLCDPVVRVPGC